MRQQHIKPASRSRQQTLQPACQLSRWVLKPHTEHCRGWREMQPCCLTESCQAAARQPAARLATCDSDGRTQRSKSQDHSLSAPAPVHASAHIRSTMMHRDASGDAPETIPSPRTGAHIRSAMTHFDASGRQPSYSWSTPLGVAGGATHTQRSEEVSASAMRRGRPLPSAHHTVLPAMQDEWENQDSSCPSSPGSSGASNAPRQALALRAPHCLACSAMKVLIQVCRLQNRLLGRRRCAAVGTCPPCTTLFCLRRRPEFSKIPVSFRRGSRYSCGSGGAPRQAYLTERTPERTRMMPQDAPQHNGRCCWRVLRHFQRPFQNAFQRARLVQKR